MPTRHTARRDSSTHPFRIDQVWDGHTHTTLVDISARRCPTHRDGDQAQVEIALRTRKIGGTRDTYVGTSLILSPADARALALAICPELGAQS
jgi:hypothetical protein